jgi:two-component system response regulator HydG
MPKILLVDDDPQALESTRKILEFSDFEVVTAADGQSALEKARPNPGKPSAGFDLVITDVRMPRLGGLEFLRALSLCGETMPVILMTAFGRVEDAVWAMKLGAVDFLTKPFKRQTLLLSVEAALKRARNRGLENSASLGGGTGSGSGSGASKDLIIGNSAAIREMKGLIQKVAPTLATVLLSGESGTGKELVARCLHQQSARAQGKFVALNCAAVPEQLIESELFGFDKGAFTGATVSKEGLFEAANGGTLLLDEIGDMPFSVQAKLLRALQENEVRRLGSTAAKKVDVRVIAATHKDLKKGVQEGTFRMDLLYRLEVVGVHVPPLRERTEDIPELVSHFLRVASRRHDKEVRGISAPTMEVLLAHSWPGNVRELSNVIERAVIFATGDLVEPADLPPHLIAAMAQMVRDGASAPGAATGFGKGAGATAAISVPFGTTLKDVEELLIRKTLEATAGDKNMTAKILGINSRTIYRKLDKRTETE